MSALEIILALLKAIPALKSVWYQLVSDYVQHQISQMKEANREGIRKAIYEHDQRALETAIGSTKSGEISNRPGSSIVDANDIAGLSNQGKN